MAHEEEQQQEHAGGKEDKTNSRLPRHHQHLRRSTAGTGPLPMRSLQIRTLSAHTHALWGLPASWCHPLPGKLVHPEAEIGSQNKQSLRDIPTNPTPGLQENVQIKLLLNNLLLADKKSGGWCHLIISDPACQFYLLHEIAPRPQRRYHHCRHCH